MSKRDLIAVTGGAGFIGSEFVRLAARRGLKTLVIDNLTYAGDLARLAEVKDKITFCRADICDKTAIRRIISRRRPRVLVHFAAESHVDRSIHDASPFIQANVVGTQVLMDASREFRIERFVHMSTDEVYGEISRGKFQETSPLAPNSPYAASKASADLLVQAYIRTYGFPAVIVRASNNYGPWQYPEKLIPVIILKALKDEHVPVYAKGQNVREWLHVSDCARGVMAVMNKGKCGEIYNIGSGQERRNIDTVKAILKILGKPESLIQFVQDRPGHDFRYALQCSKLEHIGWAPEVRLEDGLRDTVLWNTRHLVWLEGKLRYLRVYWKKVYKA